MYAHNYTHIKTTSPARMQALICEELLLCHKAGKKFCRIVFDVVASDGLLSSLTGDFQYYRNGFYVFPLVDLALMQVRQDCSIRQIQQTSMLDDLLDCDLQLDETMLGRNFCIRRCQRLGEAYLANGPISAYLCYQNGQAIGAGQLFIHDGIAKIENLAVIPSRQSQGFGSAILKHLLTLASQAGCHTVYLTTSEDDSPKAMYVKNGFVKVGENSDLVFILS